MSRKNFHNQLLLSFKEQKNCDVEFEFKSYSTPLRIGAHKLILSLACDSFQTRFFGEFVQRGLFNNEKIIHVPDFKLKIFQIFLR